MILRQVLAERVSGLKRRVELETPIVEEIPRMAKILSSIEMAFAPTPLGLVPIIVRGKAYGEVAGLWYRVTFPRTLNEPSVATVGEGRGGVIPTPKAPTITIPAVSIGIAKAPSIAVAKVPTIAVASAAVPKAASIVIPVARTGKVPTSLGRFKCGWAIAGLTDGLNDLVETLESVLVRINEVVDDLVSTVDNTKKSVMSLDAKVDDLRTKVNDALDKLRANTEIAVNTGLDTLRTNVEPPVNAGLDTLRKNAESTVNSGLDTLRTNTESAVNEGLAKVIPALYDAWGIPRTMAITPIHIRNVTSMGFEFQSFGRTTCYFIAIGSLR